MRGWRTLIVGALIAVTGAAAPAAAQAPGTAPAAAPTTSGPGATSSDPVDLVAAAVAAEGWYADPGAVGDREELDRVASRLRPNGEEIGFALLDAEPPGSSQAFAEQVVDALAGNGEFLMRTVVVLSPADVGVVSDTWDDEAIDTALDESIDELRANPTDGLATFADVLGRQSTMDEDGDAFEEEDAGSFPTVLVLAIAGMGGLALLSHVAGWSSGGGEGGGSSWGSSSYRRRRSFGGGTSRSRGSSSSRRSSGGSSARRGRGSRRL